MYHIFFIHLSINGHLGYFDILAIVNSASVNIGISLYFKIVVFSGYMPSSGVTGSHGRFSSSSLRNPHTVLHNGSIGLYSYQLVIYFKYWSMYISIPNSQSNPLHHVAPLVTVSLFPKSVSQFLSSK